MSVNVSSLTCYVLLAAIENDLRDLISSVASDEPPVDVLGADIYERALQRRRKDYPRSTSPHLASLLPYIDFSDAYTVLRGQASNLRPDLDVALKNFGSQWELLVGVRNRVAHSRPLELEDLPRVLDFSHELVNLPGAPWAATRHAQAELERNPGFVLGVTPSLIKDDESPIRHNLPPADFEETGFLGRKGQRRELLRALKGPWPVISILGDGGLGKTALALQVAYDLMDDSECPFEAIVWTSAKNATLTTSEILRVESAIEDSLGLFRGAASELGGEEALKNPVQELLDYLRTFPILLILDNLETVIDDRIRDFLRQLPHGSKVLITSRIGVGTENPFKLSPLSTAEAARLIRILARVRDVHPLRDLHDGEVEDLVTRMKCHPAFIKWFVSGVQAGQAPERLVEENGLLLDYCMSNVFDYLSEDACAVLRSMIVLPGTHTLAELAFLNKFSAASIQSAVLTLTTTNFLAQTRGGASGTGYALSDFAKSYLQKKHPVAPEERTWLLERHQHLYQIGGDMQAAHARDPFSPDTIDTRSAGDFSAARSLRTALEMAKADRYDEAIDLCREAADLAPGYHEPHRVAAHVHQGALNYSEAYDAYDRARDLAPDNPYVRFFFGNFLVQTGFNARQGLQELQHAARIDDRPQIILSVAHAHLELGNVSDAVEVALDLFNKLPASSQWASDAIYIVLRASVAHAFDAYRSENWPSLAEIVEPVVRAIEATRVEDLDTYALDLCMALNTWCDAGNRTTSDEFIARRCDEFAKRLQERRRQVDPGHLGRRIGSIRNLVREKGFGFIDSSGDHYFAHISSFWDQSHFDAIDKDSVVSFQPGERDRGPNPPATAIWWIH